MSQNNKNAGLKRNLMPSNEFEKGKKWDSVVVKYIGPILITIILLAFANTVSGKTVFDTGWGLIAFPIILFWLGVVMGIAIGRK